MKIVAATVLDPMRTIGEWTTPGRCGTGQCVEVFLGDQVVAVRDSRQEESELLVFLRADWRDFVDFVCEQGA